MADCGTAITAVGARDVDRGITAAMLEASARGDVAVLEWSAGTALCDTPVSRAVAGGFTAAAVSEPLARGDAAVSKSSARAARSCGTPVGGAVGGGFTAAAVSKVSARREAAVLDPSAGGALCGTPGGRAVGG